MCETGKKNIPLRLAHVAAAKARFQNCELKKAV